MKGKLINKEGKWFVRHFDNTPMSIKDEFPLHPDNITNHDEAFKAMGFKDRDGEEVEFEIVEYCDNCMKNAPCDHIVCNMYDKPTEYARLIPFDKEIDCYCGHTTRCTCGPLSEKELWENILNAYTFNHQEHRLPFIEWLQKYYNPPTKK